MKKRKNIFDQQPAKLAAIILGAALIIIGGSFLVVTESNEPSSQYSNYRIECNTSVPAILPGMMNGFISIEPQY